MGFFKKPVRRSKARLAANALLPTEVIDPAQWSAVPETCAELSGAYLRFRVERPDNSMLGLFQAAGEWEERDDLPTELDRRLRDVLKRLNHSFAVPPEREIPPAARFWFVRDNATLLAQVWKLILVMQQLREIVSVEQTDQPGKIVYRDEDQVGAIRFADAPSVGERSRQVRTNRDVIR
jgi:hypothetical protein